MKIVVVVPAYNEARYIGRFIDKLLPVTRNIIVVDDGSQDATKEIVKSKGVLCVSHMVNLGKGAALKTGCEYAFRKLRVDAVIIMDGDDQHDPKDLAVFLKELKKGTQIVLGVRKMDAKIPLIKLLGNKIGSVIINLLFGRYIADIPSGFKGLTKQAYKQLLWQSAGYEVETEIAVRLAKSKLSYKEVEISTVYNGKEYGFNLLDACRILIKIPFWLWR